MGLRGAVAAQKCEDDLGGLRCRSGLWRGFCRRLKPTALVCGLQAWFAALRRKFPLHVQVIDIASGLARRRIGASRVQWFTPVPYSSRSRSRSSRVSYSKQMRLGDAALQLRPRPLRQCRLVAEWGGSLTCWSGSAPLSRSVAVRGASPPYLRGAMRSVRHVRARRCALT